MKIECILRRPGGTTIHISGTGYHFKPEAGNDGGPHVADVADEAHAKRLLAIREGYRPADSSSAALIAPKVAGLVDGAFVLTIAQPPTETALLEVLTALGAADPAALLSIAWPDRFPAKQTPPAAAPAPPASEPLPSAPESPLAADFYVDDPRIVTSAPPSQPAPSMVIGAVDPGSTVPDDSTAQDPDDDDDESDDDEGDDDVPSETAKRLASLDDAALRAEFERVVGRRPSGRAQRETMAAQILNALNEG